jgi:hypothetical protein
VTEIRTQLEIAATPQRVWEILADWPAYSDWNPYITEIGATNGLTTRLRLRIEPPGGRPRRLRPALVSFTPEQEMGWHGQLVLPGLADTAQQFRVEPLTAGRVRFVHSCRMTGPLRPRSAARLAGHEAGMREMNEALRARAEGRRARPSR